VAFFHLVLQVDRTIRKWLAALKKCGYVDTKCNGRCLEIVIKKWKTLSDCADANLPNATTRGNRLPQNRQSPGVRKTENPLEPAFYFACTKRYPEDFLRVVLTKVQEIPDEEIKGLGALYSIIW
jgi:hypothetical protein